MGNRISFAASPRIFIQPQTYTDKRRSLAVANIAAFQLLY